MTREERHYEDIKDYCIKTRDGMPILVSHIEDWEHIKELGHDSVNYASCVCNMFKEE